MKVNAAKAKMLAGGTAFGFELGFGSPLVAEALSRSGIDYLQIDTQHGDWGPDSTLAALVAMEGGTATPMARVARNDYTHDRSAARRGHAWASSCRWSTPPRTPRPPPMPAASRRSVRARAAGAGSGATDPDYWDWIDEQMLLMVQIESITAVENAEAILATPAWTAAGPARPTSPLDGHPPARADDRDDAMPRAGADPWQACKNTGKIPGIAAMDPEDAADRAAQGWRFINAGADYQLLMDAAQTGLATVNLEWQPSSTHVRTTNY